MADNKYLTYRGNVKKAAGLDNVLTFVTVHLEGQPTALYRLDADKLILTAEPLPCGGVDVLVDHEVTWVAGTDGRIHRSAGGSAKPFGPTFATAPTALELTANERLAVLTGNEIAIVSLKDGTLLQTLSLPEQGTCLAADPTGQWLVAGTSTGIVCVFEAEETPQFQPSESARLHEGAVTALLFEKEELRFFSAGADQKLLSTHARGKLEPEDRSRGGGMHTDAVTALVWAPGDRFLSGSRDSSVKTWGRVGGTRPATLKEGLGKVVDLAVVRVHKKDQLIVACEDNGFRIFALEEDGRFGDLLVKVHDAYAWARHEFGRDESNRREGALQALARWNDIPSIELIAAQVDADPDHGLRLLGTQLLGASSLPRAAKLLEKSLSHRDEAVRLASLEGLRKHLGADNLQPLEMALAVEKPDVGKVAVEALEKLASKDDQALDRLMQAIDATTLEVRQAALMSLERVFDPKSPEANLFALSSKHADLRRLALIRLFQRKMLGDPKVQSAIRWRSEDADAEVRRTAFLLTLYDRPKLVQALRGRDPELQRQLIELENFSLTDSAEAQAKVAALLQAVSQAAPSTEPVSLSEEDLAPLLQATASRSLDTCLRGARGLAVLGDSRAFGLLLQLSREEDTNARVEVCRAMAALDDPRSIKRLQSLLFDKEASVRDAAFSALLHLYKTDPLASAEAGLTASFEDVRRRGLNALIEFVRENPPQDEDDRAWQLLTRALNDTFPTVRNEVFKAVLNLKIAGGGADTLRFVLQSIHADVRREVLTEVMAQINEPWAWGLLLQFFNDPDAKLRGEAFAFAVKRSKELEPLEAALCSRHVDVRKEAVEALIKKHTQAAQSMLVRALADPDKDVRLRALQSLVGDDALTALKEALQSEHADVRVLAAQALARHGDATALPTLLKLATAPEPQEKERLGDWQKLVTQALDGLAELGHPDALPSLLPLLDSKHANLRDRAAAALVWCAQQQTLDALRQALQHSDPAVKYRAAQGLAYLGDANVTAIVFSAEAARILTPGERLRASLTLGPAGEDQLVVFLDDADEQIRNQALLLLTMLELKDRQPTPARCLAALSSLTPRVRLTAARALEAFADPEAFLGSLVELFNERGEEQPWKISRETVDTFAELVVRAEPRIKARTAQLLVLLAQEEQNAFDQAWSVHARRFAEEIKSLQASARHRQPPALQYSAAQLRQLAFGAYIGLVREAVRAQQQAVRLRQTALKRVLAMAQSGQEFARAAVPVFIQALGDPNPPVRLQAFEHLQTLQLDPTRLGGEALETGFTDLGVKGLEVLTGSAGEAEGQKVLEQVTLSRKDDLALEAARLLAAQRGQVAVAGLALTAVNERLRERAVHWLSAEYEKSEEARKLLREALGSRYHKVRETATFELAKLKAPEAVEALIRLLQASQDTFRQRTIITALVTLNDPRGPVALLDRLENDPSGTAAADELIRGAGRFRMPHVADRLLALMTANKRWRNAAFDAVLMISGYDQKIEDWEESDEPPKDRDWEKKQFPRHDAVLARLLETCLSLGETGLLSRLMPAAKWSRGKEVEPILCSLVTHSDEKLRHAAIDSLGWRLRRRKGEAEPLLRALQLRDPVSQFLAAEALALAGRKDGLSVLLSGVDFLGELAHRRQAVIALGKLADARALDLLLKLASEDGHALQDVAVEAIGHMRRSDKADAIFQLLLKSLSLGTSAAMFAVRGLRWFGSPEAWQVLREKASDSTFRYRATAIEQLGWNNTPATRDLLLRLLREETALHQLAQPALKAARQLWGEESLEPDYAILQNKAAQQHQVNDSLNRVSERGDVDRIFEIMPRCQSKFQNILASSVIHRPTLPVDAARKGVASDEPRTVQLAAHILGRAGSQAGPEAARALENALGQWLKTWDGIREKARTDHTRARELKNVGECLRRLIWAAGRMGAAQQTLVQAATSFTDDPQFRELRREVVSSLAWHGDAEPVLAALEKLLRDSDAEVRTVAADALARASAARASRVAQDLLADRVSFNRLRQAGQVDVAATLRQAARQIHYQGVVVPQLTAAGDLDTLEQIVQDRGLPEATRLGALEGLSGMGREDAEQRILKVARDETFEEELRKAAWRCLHRSRRLRQKKASWQAMSGVGGS